ncbi:recombination protein RecR [Candidatus Dependentiae bacterium]|nr:recombination protein RecR [Candidatus Dependentiae bacterium]
MEQYSKRSLSINSFDRLVNNLSKLPTIGSKTAVRLASFIIKSEESFVEEFAESITNAKQTISFCKICGNYAENEYCIYCSNPERTHKSICVVEEPLDIFNIENTGNYKGMYHVLLGTISIHKGIGPANLNIGTLLNRLKENTTEEIIIATNPTLDGDSTALFLKKKIEELGNFKITRPAMGLPSGSVIEFTDRETLSRAFVNRIKL